MINNHVVSLDLAKQLYEAGIKIESEFWWVISETHTARQLGYRGRGYRRRVKYSDGEYKEDSPVVVYGKPWMSKESEGFIVNAIKVGGMIIPRTRHIERYPAPLASELGELLPDSIFTSRFRAVSLNHQVRAECLSHIEEADTEANARAKMLIYLKQRGLI